MINPWPLKEFLVEAAIKQAILNHALNIDEKIEVLRNKKALNEEVENIIMEAVTKSKPANKHDYKIIIKAVKESLKEVRFMWILHLMTCIWY